MARCSKVWRSPRKTKTVHEEKFQRTMELYLQAECDRVDELAIDIFPGKGRGIVTMRNFKKGEFVAEYAGDLLQRSEAKRREERCGVQYGRYLYYFKYNNRNLW